METDTVCLSDYKGTTTCVKDFDFFVITEDQGLTYDGILGFSPPYASNGPSFM